MTKVGVLGAGTMGEGIAQVAAQQGMDVVLWSRSEGRLDAALQHIRGFMQRNVERGRMTQPEANAVVERIRTTQSHAAMADVDLAIETIVEDIATKHEAFQQLDSTCPAEAILATNTSSLSVTEIAASTKRPETVVGLHFFNPVPLMGLVEVVAGNATSEETMERSIALMREMGKTPVRAADTPGFIVNRVVRPYYNEALRILNDGVAPHAEIDRVMKLGGNFRMGPFELMDLIGNDVNLAVTSTVFHELYDEPKFRPSFRQRRVVQSGNLGRKTRKGWYVYDGQQAAEAESVPPGGPELPAPVAIIGDGPLADEIAAALATAGRDVRLYRVDGGGGDCGEARRVGQLEDATAGARLGIDATAGSPETKREVVRALDAALAPDPPLLTLALSAPTTEIASWCGDPSRVAGFGLLPPLVDTKLMELAPALQSGQAARSAAEALAAALGKESAVVGDDAGLVLGRILALIVNEAAFAVQEGVATAADIDTAVRLGANYPHGPLEWGDLIGLDLIYSIMRGMREEFGEDRYRMAPLLRKMVIAGRLGRKTGRGFYEY